MTATIPAAANSPAPPIDAAPDTPQPPATPEPAAEPAGDKPRDAANGKFLRISPIKLPGVQARTRSNSKTLAQEIDEAHAASTTGEPPAEPANPEGEPADPNAPPEPAPAKVKVDGKEFDTAEAALAHAEAQLKVARNSQAAASRNAQLQANRAKQEIEQQYATRLAALEQRILAQPSPANQPADPNAPPPTDPSEQQFWAEILQARQSAALIADPAARAREELLINYATTNFLMEKRLNDLQAKIDARFQPFEMTQAQSQQLAAAESLFESVAHHTNSDSTPQFPELLDATDADGVVQIWHAQTRGMKAEDRHDPRQVVLAVLAYRALKAEMTKGQPPRTPAAPPTPKPAPPAPRPAANGAVLQQSNLNGAPRTSLPGGQTLPGVWPKGTR